MRAYTGVQTRFDARSFGAQSSASGRAWSPVCVSRECFAGASHLPFVRRNAARDFFEICLIVLGVLAVSVIVKFGVG
jgi:hypothetical protein